jgi:thioredoxin-like negative regulator of GroEL
MKFISITPSNVSEYTTIVEKQHMPALVKIYSPQCGHCQAMQSDWNKLNNNTELKGLNVAIIEVRNDALDKLNHSTTKNVNGFPTIRAIVNGKIKKEYDGSRNTNDMINFIKETLGKPQNGGRRRHSKKRKSIRRKTRTKTRTKTRNKHRK